MVRAGSSKSLATAHLNEQSLRIGQRVASCVDNPRLAPMFAAFATDEAALHANGRSRRHGAKVIDLHLSGHGGQTLGSYRLAHRLVQQRGDDAAMQITGGTLEAIRNRNRANHASVLGKQEFKAKAGCIGRAAAEAAALGLVRHGGEFIDR